ncbi:MAG: creatininase family protein [Bryobacterales bacterium]|nr:creatininase family protein [Bryobacterales bacterium]
MHAVLLLLLIALPTAAQVLQLQDLNTRQILELDRNKTAIVIPGGILEEHGPYLPAFTDGYLSQRMAADVASAIAARPGWKALVFPQIPLGAEPYNHLGAKVSFPGSYPIRSSTLRAVFMDIAGELGEQGFRWIIVVHIHGAGLHNRALDQASDYFHDVYSGRMAHLWGMVPVIGAWGKAMESLPDAVKKEDGVSLHGGMDETSLMLYLRPELVAADYKRAPVQTGATLDASMQVAREAGWNGYVGSPRLATRELGERIWKALSASAAAYANKVLDGEDTTSIKRYGDLLGGVPAYVKVDEGARESEAAVARKQSEWLKSKGIN